MFGRRSAKFKIKRFSKEIEPQETLLDSLAQKKEEELGISEKKLEVPLSQTLLRVLWFGFLALTLLLFGKTAQLQIIQGEEYSKMADDNRFVIRLIQAQRGVIYDRNLNQLVFNKPSFDLICRVADLPEDEGKKNEIIKEVSEIIQANYESVMEKINKADSPTILIEENLNHQTLVLFEARSYELTGFETVNNTVREYVSGPTFAHLIGYQRKTGEMEGVEQYYDDILGAQPGEIQIKRDVFGNPISREVILEPSSGQSLVLYLDSGFQEKLASALENTIRAVGSKSGAAVAMDPKTGGVLAMVSYPTYDNNLFSQGMTQSQWEAIGSNKENPLFNRTISGEYPTGSTIKPLVATAALEDGLISPDKSIFCQGEIVIPNPWLADVFTVKEDNATHGWTDMREAIAESCNVYFYTIGGGYEEQDGLGPTKIKSYLKLFGWSELTGIDLSGEKKGLIPDPAWKKENKGEDWWDGDTYNLAIGQGDVLATPLQVATAFSAVANGGTLYQPQIVKNILNGEEFSPKIIRKDFAAPENLEVVREGMRGGVTYGSSVLLSTLPVSSAAKTGTAQTWQDDVYHNWVTVFAPYENPEIVLTVIVENVPGVQAAALPVAREALEWYFTR